MIKTVNRLPKKASALILTDKILNACYQKNLQVTEKEINDLVTWHSDFFEECTTAEEFVSMVQLLRN